MTLEIRKVRPSEYDVLGRLTVAAYQALEGGDLGSYAEELADVAARAAAAEVLVAVDDGALLGGVTFVAGPQNPYAEDLRDGEVGIRMLAVDPAAQSRGVGRALSVACVERARSVAAQRVALHSTPWMLTAHRLYESIGFVRTPERDLRVSPELVLMSFILLLQSDR
jgi:GNAT superfamily N-acetyltransferase